MARDRQKAKQRQAERRAARLAARSEPDQRLEAAPQGHAEDWADLAAGAPPEDTGRSDTVTESPPAAPDTRAREDLEPGPPTLADDRQRESHEHRQHGRLVSFLIAVWAELKRVQWPDRPALTTLTGVVLLFVLIAGSYLGLLDAIFSRIIEQIL